VTGADPGGGDAMRGPGGVGQGDGPVAEGSGRGVWGAPGWIQLYLRLALGAGFLSAVADRLGLWGPPGTPGVAWGDLDPFFSYTATLNPWAPEALIDPLGILVTVAEVALGLALVAGLATRRVALASGGLLTLFALGMVVGTGPKSALDASVFAAAGGAFALSRLPPGPLSLDRLLDPGGRRARSAPSARRARSAGRD